MTLVDEVSVLTTPISVGVIAALSGGSSYFGRVIMNGVRLGLNERAIRDGVNLIPIELDDEGDDNKVVSCFNELVANNVVAIIGPMESHTAGQIVALANQHKVPVISPAATASGLTEGDNSWFFRATPSDRQKVEMLSKLVGVRHPQGNILVFFESSGIKLSQRFDLLCGEAIALDIMRDFPKAGHVFTLVPYDRNLTDDKLRSAVEATLKQRSFAAAVVIGRSADTLRVSRSIRDFGWQVPIYLMSPGKEMFSKARLENLFAVTDTVIETVNNVEIARFRLKYMNEYPGAQSAEAIDQYAIFGYDAAFILCDAIQRAKIGLVDKSSIEKIRENIRNEIADTPVERMGLMSEGGFNKHNEIRARPHVQQLSGGVWKELSFQNAVATIPVSPNKGLYRVRVIMNKSKQYIDHAERNAVVRSLNLLGYIAAGIGTIYVILNGIPYIVGLVFGGH